MAGRDFADCQRDLTGGIRSGGHAPNLKPGALSRLARSVSEAHALRMLLRDALGACIRRARLDRGRSLGEVAEQAGVSLSHLSADNIPDG